MSSKYDVERYRGTARRHELKTETLLFFNLKRAKKQYHTHAHTFRNLNDDYPTVEKSPLVEHFCIHFKRDVPNDLTTNARKKKQTNLPSSIYL